MKKIIIIPISVNRCWQGRRFKTLDYRTYWQELHYQLPKVDFDFKGKLIFNIEVGLSNKNSDLDNVLKPIGDILQEKYKFNDKQIYKIIAEKKDCKKGEEYIKFNFRKYE